MALRIKKKEKPIIYMELFGLKGESYRIKNEVEAFFTEHGHQVMVIDRQESAEYVGDNKVSFVRLMTNIKDFKKKLAPKFSAIKSIHGIRIDVVIFNKNNLFTLFMPPAS